MAEEQIFNIDKYDKMKDTTAAGINTIDTINDVGSLMNERILNGIKKTLSRMDTGADLYNPDNKHYTPLASATLKLAKELGITTEFDDISVETLDAKGAIEVANGDIKNLTERDNSMGESLVVNPPFQFNPNDDVRSDLSFPFYGRVFHDKIESNYPVVVFEVGTIKYNTSMLSNTSFSGNDSDPALTDRIRSGDGIDLKKIIGAPVAMVGSVLRTSWKILTFAPSALLGLRKFATFSVDTALFARYFNDLAQSLATSLGLLEPLDASVSQEADFSTEEAAEKSKKTILELIKDMYNNPRDLDAGGAYAGARRRLIFESIVPSDGLASSVSDFIPFVVDKDVSVSESINNSTQPNPLATNLNAAAAEAAAERVNNYSSGTATNFLKSTAEQIQARLERFKASFFRGEATTVISGEGRITLPDMWSDSSFSRSVTLNFTFTSPYGHKLAILENTYIPFLLLFCMAMPRQIGSKTFTNPFFVRVTMKGRFFIPMGIIESLTIDRGEDKNNWTADGIPRTIKCSVTIKDLSPTMMLGMSSGSLFSLFQGNDGLSSYISTLGGLSVFDMRNLIETGDRFLKKISARQRANLGKDATIPDILLDTINPFSYAEPTIRSLRSGWVGKSIVRLSQAGLNPFDSGKDEARNY